MSLPKKCVLDTNVPKTANLATENLADSDISLDCILACVEAVEHVLRTRGVVIDDADEIFDEYRNQLALRGQPGIGDAFMKWLNDYRWSLPADQRVTISATGDTYLEFPVHDGLNHFDRSDRKFVAVANTHPEKPPILQATDSKWWGWKDALAEVGITVKFLCPDYVQAKYSEKIET